MFVLATTYAVQTAQLREIGRAYGEAYRAAGIRAGQTPAASPKVQVTFGADPALRAGSPGTAAANASAAARGMAYPKVVQDVMRRVRREPAFQRMMYAQAGGRVEKDYSTFFKRLEPATADTLAELLHRKAALEVDSFMLNQDWTLKWDERRQRWAEIREERWEINKAIRDLLGPEDYGDYREYVGTLPERREVAGFKDKLYAAGLDLNSSQEEALVLMMHESRERRLTEEEDAELFRVSRLLPEERGLKPEVVRLMRQEFFQNRYEAGAELILTPEQLDLYREYLRQLLDYSETYVDYMPSPDIESHNGATVEVPEEAPVSSPLLSSAADTPYFLWGDVEGGSKWKANATNGNVLAFDTDVGTGWGSGITWFPDQGVKNQDNSVNVAGATRLVVRLNAPEGVRLRFGLLESGATSFDAAQYFGVNGADGEAFRHEGVKTAAGWQTYTIPLSDLKLNGGYGNQKGNRRIDTQALKGIEILVPGGEKAARLEIDWVRLE